MASGVIPVDIAAGAIGPASAVSYFGFSLRESAGAAAAVRIRVGSVSGSIIDDIAFAPNESVREWYGPQGLRSDAQLFVELVSGTLPEGTVRVG